MTDLEELWQRALESDKGISLSLGDESAAAHLRFRLYSARRKLQREAKKLFAPDNPRHGKSLYDEMLIRIKGGELTIVKTNAIEYNIKELI